MVESRKILHIDQDCFYAAVEMRDDHSLRGKPVAVGGASGRGVVATCNYRAREFGVRSAMPVFIAKRQCPDLVLIEPRMNVYSEISREIRSIFHSYTALVEPLSLDEAYLDISHSKRDAFEVAAEIRQEIRERLRLPSSAGVSYNKLLAKIASGWNKPNGQFEVKRPETASFMEKLPVSQIWGVGPRMAESLAHQGITLCGQLQQWSLSDLVARYGKFGSSLYEMCRGIDHRPVNPNRERKSLSVERTMTDLIEDRTELFLQVEKIHSKLVESHLRSGGRNVDGLFAKIKFSDFTETSVSVKGTRPALETFRNLVEEAASRSPKPIRLVGLGIRFAESGRVEQLELPLL